MNSMAKERLFWQMVIVSTVYGRMVFLVVLFIISSPKILHGSIQIIRQSFYCKLLHPTTQPSHKSVFYDKKPTRSMCMNTTTSTCNTKINLSIYQFDLCERGRMSEYGKFQVIEKRGDGLLWKFCQMFISFHLMN